MALSGFMTLTGQKQGKIKGSVTQKGRVDMIEVIGGGHSIISPRDAASGLPSGKRMHKPFVIIQELDISAPLLYNALVGNENITTWKLDYFASQIGNDRTTATALEQNHFSVELVNASIASIDFRHPNNKHADLMKFKEYLEVAYVYQKITWTWIKGGVTASDDWEAPNVS
jgi:type VI secretion system secreted protein Hcp